MSDSAALARLLSDQKGELLERWRRRARRGVESAQPLDRPTLDDHVPMIVDGVIASLEREAAGNTEPPSVPGAPTHGVARLHDGYDPAEVVAELAMLRACTFEIAEGDGLRFSGKVLELVNEAYDRAIGEAVFAYSQAMNNAMLQRQAEHLSFIAHDLRSPLGAISLSVEALVRSAPAGQPDDAVASRLLRNLSRNVNQLTRLVDNVLEANVVAESQRRTLLRSTRLRLRELVEGLTGDLETLAAEAGSVFLNEVPETLELDADATLLGRALQNLLANAVEHASPGVIEVHAEVQGDHVTCRVRDHGRGMPPRLLERVQASMPADGSEAFAPDRNAAVPSSSGHGLGLVIARQFVEAHGGHLQVSSRSDGTTIRIELPLRQH